MSASDPRRQLLLELFQAGLATVAGRSCTGAALKSFNLDHDYVAPGAAAAPRIWAAALGKAASAMALGAHDALGPGLERVLIVTKDGHVDDQTRTLPGVEVLLSAHPVPDARSVVAGDRVLQWLAELPHAVEPLFLISGGASSLVEALNQGVTLADLKTLNSRLLADGAPIVEINRQRALLSRIKAGQLTQHLNGRRARALFISDVPGDDPAIIGSGILGPAAAGPDRVERRIIASIGHAVDGVCAEAKRRGYTVGAAAERFDGEAERLAVRFAHELHLNREVVRVWGGESTVRLPQNPGRGGRSQQLALAAARMIAGRGDLLLLAAGTDGTDGPTEDAGALVDCDTCGRIALANIDIEASLKRADAGTALEASGDLIHSGPTGTNVGDLVIGLRLPNAGGERS